MDGARESRACLSLSPGIGTCITPLVLPVRLLFCRLFCDVEGGGEIKT